MEPKTIVITLAACLVIIGLFVWGGGVAPSTQGTPGPSFLTAPETFYDFGTISMANGNVSKVFKITNPTNKDVILEGVETSCMCTTAYIKNGTSEKGPFGMPGHGGGLTKANEVIKAGESRDIKVVYDPNAHGPAGVGLIQRTVTVENDGRPIEFDFKVIVTP